nr:Copper efflux oxidase [Candidatus Pantoea persica]
MPSAEGANACWLQLMMEPQLDQEGMAALMQRYGDKAMGKAGDHHAMHGEGGNGMATGDARP